MSHIHFLSFKAFTANSRALRDYTDTEMQLRTRSHGDSKLVDVMCPCCAPDPCHHSLGCPGLRSSLCQSEWVALQGERVLGRHARDHPSSEHGMLVSLLLMLLMLMLLLHVQLLPHHLLLLHLVMVDRSRRGGLAASRWGKVGMRCSRKLSHTGRGGRYAGC